MRITLSLTVLLFVVQFSSAQLSVKPSQNGQNNYILVKGISLFVANNVHLIKNPHPDLETSIYIRSEGQFLQGEQQDSENSGNGSLSIFQEGTSNAYDYNYWSSPVSSPENGFFGISMLNSPRTLTTSTPTLVTSSFNGSSSPLTISDRWIYTFFGENYDAWHHVGDRPAIGKGQGFTMKGVDGKDGTVVDGRANNPGSAQRYDFRGAPNSGTIELPILAEQVLLVGNPYSSALDLSLFLLENSGTGTLKSSCTEGVTRNNSTTGIAYFWDSQDDGDSHYLFDYVGGYGAFSPVDPCTEGIYEKPIFTTYGTRDHTSSSSGKNINRRYLPIAQGFMVQGASNENVRFRNGQRIFNKEGINSDFKMAETSRKSNQAVPLAVIPKIRLEVGINDEYVRSLTLAFWPSATKARDPGMDAAAYDVAYTDVGFLHDDENYVIDVRPFDIQDEISLFLKVENNPAKFIFAVKELSNFPTKNILIFDSETNVYHSFSEESVVLQLEKGDFNGRFRITFMERFISAELPEELTPIVEEEEKGFSVFQNNRMNELEIISDSFSPVKSVGIFDLQGKKVFFRSNFQNRRSISISSENWAPGIYIVKITNTNNKLVTKKISVYNNK